jgi:uncharacterized protein (TIGR03437 family)
LKAYTFAAAVSLSVVAFGQKNPPAASNSTNIVSIQNLASGQSRFSPGSLAQVLWCDLEFPAVTTPITSVLVHGQFAAPTFVDKTQTTLVTSVAYHGYPGFTPREFVIQLPNIGLPTGKTDVQIMRGAAVLASTGIQADIFAPGLFTMDGQPNGPVLARNGIDYVAGSNVVHVGDAITIYCEGLGPTTPFVPIGVVPTFPAVVLSPPQVVVGNMVASVSIAKLVEGPPFPNPSPAGMYEVTFVIPPVNTNKGSQPIYVQTGGFKSNVASLTVVP